MSRPAAIKPLNKPFGYLKMLVYGDPGTRKSDFIASGSKTLILASDEEEMITPALRGSSADMWVVHDHNDLGEADDFLRHGTHDYETVVLDNGTLFMNQTMDQIMDALVASKPHRSRWVPDMAQYQENMMRLGVWIREFKKLPCNLIITAHSMRVEDPDTGSIMKMPELGSKKGDFSQMVCGYMNVIGYFEKKNVGTEEKPDMKVRMITRDREDLMSKDRFGVIGDVVSPTMPKVLDKILTVSPNFKGAGAAASPTKRPVKKAAKKSTTTRRRSA